MFGVWKFIYWNSLQYTFSTRRVSLLCLGTVFCTHSRAWNAWFGKNNTCCSKCSWQLWVVICRSSFWFTGRTVVKCEHVGDHSSSPDAFECPPSLLPSCWVPGKHNPFYFHGARMPFFPSLFLLPVTAWKIGFEPFLQPSPGPLKFFQTCLG